MLVNIDFFVQVFSMVNIADSGYMREMTRASIRDTSTGTLYAVL